MAYEYTVEEFRSKYPEFVDSPDSDVSFALELATEMYSCSANAVYALCAHILALSDVEGTGEVGGSIGTLQTVKKSRVGRISTEFLSMTSNPNDAYFETTPYGKRFLALKNSASKRLCSCAI